jgi:hypothetical protein
MSGSPAPAGGSRGTLLQDSGKLGMGSIGGLVSRSPEILIPGSTAGTGNVDEAVSAQPALINASEKDVCGLCDVQFSRYTCPKCNVPYCSLVCYKSDRHADCAEG